MTAEPETGVQSVPPKADAVSQSEQGLFSGELMFPPSFRFGVADSDLQVIGTERTAQDEGSELTEWDMWAQEFHGENNPYHKHGPKRGIDRYRYWKEDLRLIHELGIENYRTSVSMSRTLTRNGDANRNALEWYRNYFKAIKDLGIHLYVTLYHWELPQYLADEGGWKNLNAADHLIKHAQVVAEYLGEFIDEYFILNEPWVTAMFGYHWGINPPGERDLRSGLRVAHNLLLAQGMVFETLKSKDPQMKISTVFNVEPAYANTAAERDKAAAMRYDGYFNRWFLDPVFRGEYPHDMIEFYEEKKKMVQVSQGDMQQIKIGPRLHRLGINYYRGATVENLETTQDSHRLQVERDLNIKYSPVKRGALTDSAGAPIYLPPQYQWGLYDYLQQAHQQYKDYGLDAIYVTENGIALCDSWDGRSEVIDDYQRIFYLQEHLRQVHKAISDGINVQGYFSWTLMDNYEWSGGYDDKKRFGLFYVERETLERIPKRSAFWYRQVCTSRGLKEVPMYQAQQDKLPETSLLQDEYTALRNEIVTRTGIQHQLISIALVASGTILSIGITETTDLRQSTAIILLYPILATLIAASWKHNDIRIRQLGTYIRRRIESQPSTHLGWEGFFARQKDMFATVAPAGIFIVTQIVSVIAAILKAGNSMPRENLMLLAIDIGLVIVTLLMVNYRPKIAD